MEKSYNTPVAVPKGEIKENPVNENTISIITDYLSHQIDKAYALLDKISMEWENDKDVTNLLSSIPLLEKLRDDIHEENKVPYGVIKMFESLSHIHFIGEIHKYDV